MRRRISAPVSGKRVNVETGTVTSYPTPPASTMAWFGCFSSSTPRNSAIINSYCRGMARRRFFVDGIRGGAAELRGDDARHLTRVLRAQPGQLYEITDSRRVYLAEISEARGDCVLFRVLAPVPSPEPPVSITLLAALIKFDRFEWII